MMTLDEAWRWYASTRRSLLSFARIGRKYGNNFPEESPLWKDDSFKSLNSDTIIQGSDFSLEHLDEFAVMIFFSVFESIVREQVISRVEVERWSIDQELLLAIVNASLHDLRKKSFYRVLDVFKGMDAELVEEVNQVRRYRNWVAHGRRSSPPFTGDPEIAQDRLQRFLDKIPEE